MSEVPCTRTPTDASSLYRALVQAWPTIVGGTPTSAALMVLLAQSAFETGHWGSVYNWNFGGAKHVDGDGRDYAWCKTTEGNPPQPTMAMFRAFSTLEAGAADYLQLLYKRFGKAWSYVLAGDPSNFVRKLKALGYFTGDETAYENGVVSNFNTFVKQFGGALPTPSPEVKKSGIAVVEAVMTAVGGAVLGTLAFEIYERWVTRRQRHR